MKNYVIKKSVLLLMVILTAVQFSCSIDEDDDGDDLELVKGYAEYQYANVDALGNTDSYRVKVVLCGPDITLNGKIGGGIDNVLMLTFNSGSSSAITARSYYYGDYDSKAPGVIVAGDFYENMDASTFQVYQNYVYEKKGWLCKGFVTVTNSGNSYTFDIDLTDLYDFEVKGKVTIDNLQFY